jgi:hypothetical protein
MLKILSDSSIPISSFFEGLESHFPLVHFEGCILLPNRRLYVRKIDSRTVAEILEWLNDYVFPENLGYWNLSSTKQNGKTFYFIEILSN